MNNRERILEAVHHRETEIIPYNIYFTQLEYDIMAKYFSDEDFYSKINNHISMAGCDMRFENLENSLYQDNFGVIWDRSGVDKDIGVIKNYVINEPNVSLINLPKVNHEILRQNYEQLLKEKQKNQFTMASISFSLFERAWSLCGMENFLIYMLTEPEFVNKILDAICERNCEIIDESLKYDFDGFHFGDDWGQQSGLIMGAPLWRKFILPRIKKMYGRVKASGKIVSQHSCGDIEEIFDDLINAGLDIYQTFQPEIYDIVKIKQHFGNKLTFWGGISTQRLLSSGSPSDVRKTIIETIKIMGKNGGYILAPTHAVEHDVPPQNIDMFLNIAKNQREYLG